MIQGYRPITLEDGPPGPDPFLWNLISSRFTYDASDFPANLATLRYYLACDVLEFPPIQSWGTLP